MLTYIFLPRHLASAAGTGHWMNCVFGLSQYSCSYGQLMRWSQQRPTAAHGKKWARKMHGELSPSLRQMGTSLGLTHGKKQGEVHVKYCLIPRVFSPK